MERKYIAALCVTCIIVICFFISVSVPLQEKEITIKKQDITSNRPFAGVLTVNEKNFYESFEPCCVFWLAKPDSIKLIQSDYLFYSTLKTVK